MFIWYWTKLVSDWQKAYTRRQGGGCEGFCPPARFLGPSLIIFWAGRCPKLSALGLLGPFPGCFIFLILCQCLQYLRLVSGVFIYGLFVCLVVDHRYLCHCIEFPAQTSVVRVPSHAAWNIASNMSIFSCATLGHRIVLNLCMWIFIGWCFSSCR